MNILLWVVIGAINGFAILAAASFFRIEPVIVMVVLLPVDIIIMVMFSFYFNFRPSVKPEKIPKNLYSSRVEMLKGAIPELDRLGFDKTDEFYLRILPDTVVFFFRHRELPVYMCLYHMGQKIVFDTVSIFEGDISLTSAITPEAGNLPIGPRNMLQILTGASYRSNFDFHMEGLEFLKEKGYAPVRFSDEGFREAFMKSIREAGERVRSHFLWPVKLLLWVVTVRGNAYVKPISQQFKEGMIKTL